MLTSTQNCSCIYLMHTKPNCLKVISIAQASLHVTRPVNCVVRLLVLLLLCLLHETTAQAFWGGCTTVAVLVLLKYAAGWQSLHQFRGLTVMQSFLTVGCFGVSCCLIL